MSAVRVDGGLSDWFVTIVGVLQGCVLSPLLFNILLEIVMMFALEGSDAGICINGCVISNLRFADDISLLTNSDLDLQQLVDKVSHASSRFGLTINSSETEVQVIGRDVSQVSMHIKLGNTELNQAHRHTRVKT